MPFDTTNTCQELTDEELVACCQRELPMMTSSYEILIHRYTRYIYRHVYHLVRNQQDTEDITQEIFIKVYRNIATFEHRATFTTWLYRIMVNCVLDAREKVQRQYSMNALTLSYERHLCDEKHPLSHCSPQKEKGESILLAELREDIAKTLNALDPQQAYLLLLRDYYGLSYYEIAQRYGLSLSGAKMRILRARQAFRTFYTDR